MDYKDIITKVSKEIQLPYEVVNNTYKAYWRFIRDTIQNLPLKNITEEEFNNIRTNFNIPSLGKLTCTYDKLTKVRERFKYINKLKEK